MDTRPHARGPVEPPFGCSGPRLVGEVTDTIVRRLGVPEAPTQRPLYVAEGPYVVSLRSRERMDVATALEEAARLTAKAASASVRVMVANAYRDELNQLIDVIREADGNRPTPPAAVARAA